MGTRSLPSLWLLLLLLRRETSAAPVQGKEVLPLACKDLEGRFYSKESQRCCYRCPAGSTPKTKCPTVPQRDCVKQCQPGQFLNYEYATPRCEDCLSCNSARDLVQKTPCTHNSSGACECRPGLYCHTSIPNTCARCSPLTTCKPGSGVKIRGTSDQDTVCEKCPLGTFSEVDSSTETCQPRPVRATVAEEKDNSRQAEVGLLLAQTATTTRTMSSLSLLLSSVPSNVPHATTGQAMNESKIQGVPDIGMAVNTSKEEEADVTTLAAALLFTLLLLAIFVVLWRKRACRKWIVPHRLKVCNKAEVCTIGTLPPAEKGPEETDLMHPKSFMDSASVCPLEMEETPSLDPEGAELLQMDGGVLMEPAMRSHTSNCIEKIYIMRADTVIVGSVSEVPPGKTCPARGEEGISGAQEQAEETEGDMHYPEQETEFSPGSDITTPVEEEWEFPCSILANEKPLESQEESSGGAD